MINYVDGETNAMTGMLLIENEVLVLAEAAIVCRYTRRCV